MPSPEPSLRASKEADLAGSLVRVKDRQLALVCLSAALREANQLSNDTDQSQVLSQIASIFAKLHNYSEARRLADRCTLSKFRLSAYSAISREFALQWNPDLTAAFGE